jgi:hypothetical protein
MFLNSSTTLEWQEFSPDKRCLLGLQDKGQALYDVLLLPGQEEAQVKNN